MFYYKLVAFRFLLNMFVALKSCQFALMFIVCLVSASLFRRSRATFNKSDSTGWHGDSFDPYIVTSRTLPSDSRFYPTLGNGFIGYKLFGNTVFVSGLYNGRTSSSHRAKVPVNLPHLSLSHSLDRTIYVQDMKKGIFSSTFSNSSLSIQQTTYAHLLYSRLLVSEIVVKSSLLDHFEFSLEGDLFNVPSADITFTKGKKLHYNSSACARRNECHPLLDAYVRTGLTNVAEEAFSARQSVTVISTDIPTKVRSFKSCTGQPSYAKFISIISVGSTFKEANDFYSKGIQSAAFGKLLSSHVRQWSNTWSRGNIEVKGDPFISQAITSSLYFLLSSFPPLNYQDTFRFTFYGVSPGGLPHGGAGEDYFGHVFWDQDFWMVPGILPLFPELAKLVVKYRTRNLVGACAKADWLRFEGASYPWEAAFTGYDVCPGDNYIRNEVHITADVIHLLQQYIYFTNDWNIFSQRLMSCYKNDNKKLRKDLSKFHEGVTENVGLTCEPVCGKKHQFPCKIVSTWDMLKETSTFWMSRIKWNQTRQKYVINHVMGPDEWHSPVNNSAFTNVIASQALKFSYHVAQHFNICQSLASKWMDAAERMYIPIDEVNHFHPEFDGFNYTKDTVKQADAIMLSFPLGASTESLARNDLLIYEQATTSRGPAMTWGMFAINWLALGEDRKARSQFLRQMKNIHLPFFVWSENADGSGSTNFLTGIGGFLQSIVYGYFGIRVDRSCLTLDPTLLPRGKATVKEMTIDGLDYRNLVLKIDITRSHIVILYVAAKYFVNSFPCLIVRTMSPIHVYSLCLPGQSVTLVRCKVELTVNLM